jgi:hypothetical protein
MKKLNFLNRLKGEKKLELIDKSEQISFSYMLKSKECIAVATLAFNAGYYESTVTQAYYSLYNQLQSLLFLCESCDQRIIKRSIRCCKRI